MNKQNVGGLVVALVASVSVWSGCGSSGASGSAGVGGSVGVGVGGSTSVSGSTSASGSASGGAGGTMTAGTGAAGAMPSSSMSSSDAAVQSSSSMSSSASSSGAGGASGSMTFFVTSKGNGVKGGNFGGLAGADAHCQALAALAKAGGHTWHAYLSTTQVDARDRIGTGPWFNAEGKMVAANVTALHQTPIESAMMLDENAAAVPLTEHDILSGSDDDGKLNATFTCYDWTTDDGGVYGEVGHVDWSSPQNPNDDWNSTHETPCSAEGMKTTLCASRLYCFAIN